MTPAEILEEIQKLPLSEQHQVLAELSASLRQLDQTAFDPKEEEFIASLKRKGVIIEIPARTPDDDSRQHFKRIEIKDRPLSETVIEERG